MRQNGRILAFFLLFLLKNGKRIYCHYSFNAHDITRISIRPLVILEILFFNSKQKIVLRASYLVIRILAFFQFFLLKNGKLIYCDYSIKARDVTRINQILSDFGLIKKSCACRENNTRTTWIWRNFLLIKFSALFSNLFRTEKSA